MEKKKVVEKIEQPDMAIIYFDEAVKEVTENLEKYTIAYKELINAHPKSEPGKVDMDKLTIGTEFTGPIQVFNYLIKKLTKDAVLKLEELDA